MTAALDLPDIDCAPFTDSPCAYRGGAPRTGTHGRGGAGHPSCRSARPGHSAGDRHGAVPARPVAQRRAAALTRRGVAVLAAAVAVVGVALVWLAAASAPAPGSASRVRCTGARRGPAP